MDAGRRVLLFSAVFILGFLLLPGAHATCYNVTQYRCDNPNGDPYQYCEWLEDGSNYDTWCFSNPPDQPTQCLSSPRSLAEYTCYNYNGNGNTVQTCDVVDNSYCCTPSCVGKNCGDNGCGGSCGSCTSPQTCVSGTCCTPSCAGKSCGDSDGCGGVCQGCSLAWQFCTQCGTSWVCTNFDWDTSHCGSCSNACSAGQVCRPPNHGNGGVCFTECPGTCAASICEACKTFWGDDPDQYCVRSEANPSYHWAGAVPDTSSDDYNCGSCGTTCTGGKTCVSGSCVCVPSCAGKTCGAGDGCGGTCLPGGGCTAQCTSGACCDLSQGVFKGAGDVCAAATDCKYAATCTGSSASCPAQTNIADGTPCTSDGNSCTTDVCSGGTCVHNTIPNDCGSRVCGASPSGCFTCGSCGSGQSCTSGACWNDCSKMSCNAGTACGTTCQDTLGGDLRYCYWTSWLGSYRWVSVADVAGYCDSASDACRYSATCNGNDYTCRMSEWHNPPSVDWYPALTPSELANDDYNCGGCGISCNSASPYTECRSGKCCVKSDQGTCTSDNDCCGGTDWCTQGHCCADRQCWKGGQCRSCDTCAVPNTPDTCTGATPMCCADSIIVGRGGETDNGCASGATAIP